MGVGSHTSWSTFHFSEHGPVGVGDSTNTSYDALWRNDIDIIGHDGDERLSG